MASITSFVTASIAAAAVGSALFTNHPGKDKALVIEEHQTKVDGKEEAAAAADKKRELLPKIAPEFDGVNCFETLVVH